MKKRITGKRWLAALLALIMWLTLLPMTALAGSSHVAVVNIAEPADDATTAAMLYNNGTVGAAYNGASYSSETNTLTLDGFDNAGQYIEISNMGNDFKLEVKNSNTVGIVEVFGGSLTITGDGALSINPAGSATMYNGYYSGIHLQAEGENAVLTVEDGPTVTVRGYDANQAVTVNGTTADDGIIVKGDADAAVKSERRIRQISVKNEGDDWSTSLMLYAYGGGWYGAIRVYSYSGTTTTVSYNMYTLTGDPDAGFTAYAPIAGESSLSAVPEKYSPVYDAFYDHTLADAADAPLNYVCIAPADQTVGQPTITTASLPSGKVGEAYTAALSGTAADGSTLSWSVENSLPSGLALDAETGVISGTPTAAGSFSFAVKATQGNGKSATKSLSISVSQPATYTVRFELNGGTETPGADYSPRAGLTAGEEITLPAAPTRSDCFFSGWSDGAATYAAGAQYTVKGDATIRAEWEETPGLTVSFPAGMEQLVGTVWLVGIHADGTKTRLWSDWVPTPTAFTTIEIPLWQLGNQTYTGLQLFGFVDGRDTVLASYSGTISGGENVALTAEAPYTVLSAINVTGLTEGVDYRLSLIEKTGGEGTIYSAPCLVTPDSSWQIRLNGVRGSSVYTLIDWDQVHTAQAADHSLCIDIGWAYWGDRSVTLSGRVTWPDGDEGVPYATVRATQKVGDVFRTLQTTADGNGAYRFKLYPNTEALITVEDNGQLYILSPAGGAAYSQAVGTEPISLDLTVKRFLLTAEVTLTAGDGTAAADLARYLNTSNNEAWLQIAAETGVDTDAFTLSGTGTIRRTTSLFYTGAASALTCTLSAPPFETLTGSAVKGSDGNWTVSFTSMLKPGVVAGLSAAQTMSACYAFYGADGAFMSHSSTFYLYTLARDYAAECPVGTAKVALVPGIYSGQLYDSTYADVTGSGWALKTWDVSMTQGRIVALEAFVVDKTASINSAYVTQPNSTLSASAESFLGEQDLVRFSGSIGLDAGLNNGGLRKLEIYTGNGQVNNANTTVVQSITVGGKNYPAQQTTGLGIYTFEFSEPIALPCDYAIYCTPGSLDWDMHVTLTADVSWSGGSVDSQRIGSAVVSRPGAYIQTLSTYVNQSAIQVSGVAGPGEAVTIYDNGAVIGTAKGDEWGEWTAMVTLAGTDDSMPTVHRLWTVTASGAVSDVLTVLHDANGPQLTKFTMSWRSNSYGDMTTINIGDAYIYRGGMYDTTFEATFTNPGALNTMEAWGCKAVFKVFTTDGEIRFLEAAQNGGVFTAAAPEALRASVTRAEVLYEPALHTGFDLSAMRGAAPAAYSAKMKAVAAEVKADTSDYPSYVYALTYDSTGKASAKALDGKAADPDFVKNLEESAGKYPDMGLVISYVTSDDHYTTPTEEWLRLTAVDASIQNWYALRIGKYASECRMYTLSRHYTGGTDSAGKELSAAEVFELEKAYFEGLETVHSVFTLDGGRYDLYTIETEGTDSDGAPYLDRYVTAAFVAVDGVYTSSFTVTYSDRVCLKLVREKLDEMYPQTGAFAAEVRTAAAGAGTANAALLKAATNAPILLMDDGQTEEQPTEVADVEVRFSSNFTPEMHEELEELRWIKNNTDCIWDAKDLRRLAELEHAEANVMNPTWLDESNYKYNGSFKPESNAARSAMNRVQNTTGVLEGYSGDANAIMSITAAAADGNAIGKAAGVNGAITAAANIYTNGVNTRDAKDELEMMRGDMEQIMSSPCYHKLTQSQKDMVDEAYDEFMQWYKTAHNHLQGVAQCNFAASSGGVFLGKNPITGLVMSGTGLMVSNVGGEMVNSSFGSAIYCYEHGFAKIKGVLRARSKQLNDPNCKGKPVSAGGGGGGSDGNGGNNKPGHDPSGIVYEGVIENPIEGALVTLYYGADAGGRPVTADPVQLKPAADIRSLIPRSATLTTGPDGKYSWGVPQGLWYVTAQYCGMLGDSSGDIEATVPAAIGGADYSLLPVLPVQLDVNIPLVDTSAPMVTDVQYTTEGIYVTFSKYMDETDVLSAASYCVYAVGADTTRVAFRVTGVEQGHTPANRGEEQTYTRTVLLAPTDAQTAGTALGLWISGTVKSYAGTPMGMNYSGGGTVAEKTQLAKPTLDPASGEVTRGSCVTITAAHGTIHYTTDGSDPTADSPVYDGPVAVTGDMTIKAIAVQRGYESSPAASGSFTVKRPEIVPEEPEEPEKPEEPEEPEEPEKPEKPVVPVNPGDWWSGEAVYKVTVAETEHGRVTASRSTAPKGVEITLTVTPDEGYVLDSLKAADARGNTVIVTDNKFTMPASDVTVTVTFEAVKKDRPFTDVKESDWFYAAVYHCFDAGYFKGVSETLFDPQGTMTRAMFATVLWRIAGEPTAKSGKSFNDVESGKWYSDSVLWASGEGILDGYGDGTFGTNDPVTREQMVTLLWRFSGKPVGNADLSGYKDADQISDWAKEAFAWAVGVGLVQGKGDGVLDPGGKATRAEVAQIVMNFDTKVK